MTKAQIITLIDTIIDNGKNKALKVRNVLKAMLDSSYDSVFSSEKIENLPNTQNNTIITAGTLQDVVLACYFKKIGNTVFVKGYIQNNSSSARAGIIATITNNDYKVKNSSLFLGYHELSIGNPTPTSSNASVDSANNIFFNVMPANSTLYFQGFYETL